MATILSPLLILLLAGQVGVPLGLPPLPEDPVMARVAPQECVWYFSSSGASDPDPKSTNQTEQLLAESEVRDLVHGVGKALSDAIRKGAPPTPTGQLLGAEGPTLIHGLLTHPAAAFITKANIVPSGLDIAGGLIVGTGDETEELKSTLEKIEHTILVASQAAPAANGRSVAGAPHLEAATKWHRFPIPSESPVVEWGFRGKYLIVGIGAGSADAISARADKQPPDWLMAIKKRLTVERVSTVHYLNVEKAVAAAGPFLAGGHGTLIMKALGLNNVQQFASVSGLEGTGCVSKSWIQTDGEPSGLLTLFGPKPLTPADLAPIPKDASFAIVARVEIARLWAMNLSVGKKIDDAEEAEQIAKYIQQIGASGGGEVSPAALQDFAQRLAAENRREAEQASGLETDLGFRFQEDLFQTLGDTWCVYNSPSDGGLLITGLTVVVPLKNHDRLVKTNNEFVKRFRKANTPGPQNVPEFGMSETTFQKQKIFCIKNVGEDLLETPFVLSWCITDKQLIVSLSPQSIRTFLARGAAVGSLADLPAVAAELKSANPVLLTYQDTAGMLKSAYPGLQMFATTRCAELRRKELDLDEALLPSLSSLMRHAEPGLSALSYEKDGLVYVSRESMPVDVTLAGLLPAWDSMIQFVVGPDARPNASGEIFSFSLGLAR